MAMMAVNSSTWAKPVDRHGIFVYSSMCWEQESGDAAGYRITIRRLKDENDSVFEYSEGPVTSLIGYDTKIDQKTQKLTFDVITDSTLQGVNETNTFSGTITDDFIKGTFVWGAAKEKWALRLKRVRDFSKETPDCKG